MPEPAIPQTGASILLVEDDPALASSLAQFLSDLGYRPHIVGTVHDGWRAVQDTRPDLCLLDMNLPDGSGLDLLRRMSRQGLRIPTIVSTALPLQNLFQSDLYPSVVGWLSKPVDPDELAKSVATALG